VQRDHDFAKDLADQVRKNRAKRTTVSQEQLATLELIGANAKAFWEELTNRLRAKMLALNEELQDEALVLSTDSKRMTLTLKVTNPDYTVHAEARLEPKSFVIETTLPNKSSMLKPQMFSGEIHFFDRESVSKSPDQIAEQMLNSLNEFI
jgi:hypothetical protein